jgi:hypothetical protein
MLEKSSEISKELTEEFDDLLVLTETSLRKIWQNRGDEIWKRYLKDKK